MLIYYRCDGPSDNSIICLVIACMEVRPFLVDGRILSALFTVRQAYCYDLVRRGFSRILPI